MASDIFSAAKGLFPSIYTEVDVPRPPASTAERVQREATIRLQRRNATANAALVFFKGKRLLGGNLLLGGGAPVSTETTVNFYSGLQQGEDDEYRLLIEQAQERVRRGQYRSAPVNRLLPQEAVARLLDAGPTLEEARAQYTSFDYQEQERLRQARQARIDALLQQTRTQIDNIYGANYLPNVSQRPSLADIIPARLIDNPLSGNIHLSLARRLTSLRLDAAGDPHVINIDELLREQRQNNFLGLNTEAEIKARQLELGLTDQQVQEEILNDARATPTHVQVTLLGRRNAFSQNFLEQQRANDPDFNIPKYQNAQGQLTTTDETGVTRTLNTDALSGGAVNSITLTYQEYLNLRYTAPQANENNDQIEYLSVIPFASPSGIIDEKTERGFVQTVALVTPKNDAENFEKTTAVTLQGRTDTYTRLEFTIPLERTSLFQGVELFFQGITFPTTSPHPSLLQQLQAATGNLLIEVEQLGSNKNYIGNQKLLFDSDNEAQGDSVRFRFFAKDPASNGLRVVLHVREDALNIPIIGLKNLQVKFF